MMSGIELLNYLQGLSEEVLDKFIIVTHPMADAAPWITHRSCMLDT
jgi:ABC-type molybdenum transport system ATPase subunit/photorepair protein PhrA